MKDALFKVAQVRKEPENMRRRCNHNQVIMLLVKRFFLILSAADQNVVQLSRCEPECRL